ncbi:hypothetical protein F2Q70_00002766 [Brassica cretica]|uniref:Uncharacterized protein n=1 Tax=Brassica cretica TaxID=69181 RepID=A0A8S9IRC4_BRACR|nr:hypothetical protein F2Q70_00002766 [Brassica cretica]
MEEPPSEEVSAVKQGETWMTPLIWYLEADILPKDRSEAIKIKKQAARGIRAGSGLQRPPILANPHKSGMTTVARPQRIKTGVRHKAGMGMRKPEYAVTTT